MLNAALSDIESAQSPEALEEVRVAWLGKKGKISEQMKTLGKMSPEERKAKGQEFNQLKQQVQQALDARREELEEQALNQKLAAEKMDVSLAPRPESRGGIHPITHVTEEIIAIFTAQGFQAAFGPDIEDDFHNFTALNIPPAHPAREMHDTFYLKSQKGEEKPVLRTHTSPVQIRTMLNGEPPHRIIAPGTTYRSDSDATHTPMFHQVEGLVIDKNIHFGHLKGCLIDFLKAFFGLEEVPLRFRSSFFPFTEPSAEVDITCQKQGNQLLLGQGEDWLEILGCGMVHPNVLKNCGLDPEEWQGFAFGMGIERLAMLKYGMHDLRPFFEGDLRWQKHYGFPAHHQPSLAMGLAG